MCREIGHWILFRRNVDLSTQQTNKNYPFSVRSRSFFLLSLIWHSKRWPALNWFVSAHKHEHTQKFQSIEIEIEIQNHNEIERERKRINQLTLIVNNSSHTYRLSLAHARILSWCWEQPSSFHACMQPFKSSTQSLFFSLHAFLCSYFFMRFSLCSSDCFIFFICFFLFVS